MFFTRVGTIIAIIAFSLATFRVGMALLIVFGAADMSENALFSQRFFGAANTGEAINEGMYVIIFSVALGILCEISRGLRNTQTP